MLKFTTMPKGVCIVVDKNHGCGEILFALSLDELISKERDHHIRSVHSSSSRHCCMSFQHYDDFGRHLRGVTFASGTEHKCFRSADVHYEPNRYRTGD